MGKVNFGADREAAERDGLVGGSDYLKVKEGANRIRLVSEAIPHPGEYKGRKNFKWLCYVLDRADAKVKPYFMPNVIHRMIEDLQQDPEYAFEEVPMPYDISVNAKNAGTKEVEYSVLPARKSVPLTPAEEVEVNAQKPLRDLRDALRARSDPDKTPERFDPDEIPI